MPRVSVIVPAYNQAHYLGEAIRSALEQTWTDLEVLVVDDGSTDDTREVAAGFSDPRVRYLHQENRGLSAARNTGLRRASGEFLTFLDSDDRFMPEKLETLMQAFARRTDLGLAAGQAALIDEHGHYLGEVFDRPLPADPSELLLGNPLHVGSVLVRRSWQACVGEFDETLRSYEDWDMWLRLARAGCPMGWVPKLVSLYRFHRQQMTRIGTQMTAATFAVLEKTFADPSLPASWRGRRAEAYSRGHLRAAAQAYTARDFTAGVDAMAKAVRLDPGLAADDGARVARLAAGWANHAKTADPLQFLESVYDHLPDELAPLRARRRSALADEALHLAAAARRRGDVPVARALLLRAIRWAPSRLGDRSVIRHLLAALLGRSSPAPAAASERGLVRRAS